MYDINSQKAIHYVRIYIQVVLAPPGTEDHDRCFSILVLGAFSTGVFNTNALPKVRDERTHPHRLRLVVSHSTCPPLSSSPPANSFVLGPAVINTHIRMMGVLGVSM